GEDACLFDYETASEAYHSDNEVARCDPEASNNVDMFVAKIAEDMDAELEEEELLAQRDKSDGKAGHQQSDIVSKEVGSDTEIEKIQSLDCKDRAPQVDHVTLSQEIPRESASGDKEHEDLSLLHGEPFVANLDKARDVPGKAIGSGGRRSSDAQLNSRKRTKSCPPGR
ncbi:hypothetical protein A2U01_0039739, partial [Trifolium medium]|nr:hypothetical protein [Trifolium medium]